MVLSLTGFNQRFFDHDPPSDKRGAGPLAENRPKLARATWPEVALVNFRYPQRNKCALSALSNTRSQSPICQPGSQPRPEAAQYKSTARRRSSSGTGSVVDDHVPQRQHRPESAGVAEVSGQLPHRRRPGPGPSGDAACYVGSGRRRLRLKWQSSTTGGFSVKVEAEKTLTEN